MDIKLKYVWEDVDRHGNVRVYVAAPGRKKIRIREAPGTAEFLSAYDDALNGIEQGGRVHGRGTFGFVCKRYYDSKTFKRLDEATQDWRRQELDKVAENDGDKPIARMESRHIEKLRDTATTDNMGNLRLAALKALFKWAKAEKLVSHNPAKDVEQIEVTSEGHHTWLPEEREQFETFHKVGTKARLAYDLARFTTGRREDLCRLGPQHMRHGRLVFTQAKNEHRKPSHMDIPIHPALQRSIDATPSHHLVLVPNAWGKPFKPDSFNNWFRKQVKAAGLPARCTPHGIRKATSAELAELGASPHQIQSLTGHKTLKEVQVYTDKANRARLANTAMDLLTNKEET